MKAQSSPCICEKRVGRRINILTAVIAKDYLKDVKAFICLQELWHMVRNGLKIYCHLCWMRFKVFLTRILPSHHLWKNPSESVKLTESRQRLTGLTFLFIYFLCKAISRVARWNKIYINCESVPFILPYNPVCYWMLFCHKYQWQIVPYLVNWSSGVILHTACSVI